MPGMRLFQAVRLRVAIPSLGLARGTPGRVIDLNPKDPDNVEVEFHVADGSKSGRFVEWIVRKDQLDVSDG
ncbi:MAG: hypothetical protein HMLKMBBP_00316 [Planctomycetes bacterium]|nr:hypothetical protein [Planctomycetota bacterium]